MGLSISAPRFASRDFGGPGAVYADTMDVSIDGKVVDYLHYDWLLLQLADDINHGTFDPDFWRDTLRYFVA